jgi:hypothetical protein
MCAVGNRQTICHANQLNRSHPVFSGACVSGQRARAAVEKAVCLKKGSPSAVFCLLIGKAGKQV